MQNMQIGVLSDTHNNIGNLVRALRIFEEEGIRTLIHCGDMANETTAQQLDGFEVVYVNGNVDHSVEAVNDVILGLGPRNFAGAVFAGKLNGVAIAATHGHRPDKLRELVRARRYNYVFHGHTHRRRDEVVGETRVINPGALGGARHEPRSVCVVDLDAATVRFIDVADW